MQEQEKYSPAFFFVLVLTLAFFVAAYRMAFPAGAANDYAVAVQRETTEPTAPQRILVDINAADAVELETLTGIGSTLAERIVDYREEHGAFAATEDLLHVSGIGEKKLESFRHEITLGGQAP